MFDHATKTVKITRIRGSHMNLLGHSVGPVLCLQPEEALHLIDRGLLSIKSSIDEHDIYMKEFINDVIGDGDGKIPLAYYMVLSEFAILLIA